MEVVKTEFEILRISEPVSLPFKGLDLVYHTLAAAGDPVIEVVGKSSAAGTSVLPTLLKASIPVFMTSRNIKQEDFIFRRTLYFSDNKESRGLFFAVF